MMDDLKELYQQVILDHNRNPKNFGKLDPHTHFSEGFNPLCGDKVDVYLDVADGTIQDVHFEGSGCAISKASASLMTTLVKNKSIDDATTLFKQFHDMITSEKETEIDFDTMGKLAVLAGVREFPTRVKCASLAWHTFMDALKKEEQYKE